MITIEGALHTFLKHHEANGASAATLHWYMYALARFAKRYGATPLEEITQAVLLDYVVDLRHHLLSDESKRGYIRATKDFWNWVCDYFEIDPRDNPARKIKTPAPHKRLPEAIDLVDLLSMLRATDYSLMGKRDRALMYFLIDTGCRVSELLGLRDANLHLDLRYAKVTGKGSKERIVPFTRYTALKLRAWLSARPRGAEAVFCSLRERDMGRPLSDSGLRLILDRVAARAHVSGPHHPHSFRHRMALEFRERGGDPGILAQILGHEDVSTTINIYGQYSQQVLIRLHQRFSFVGELEAQHENPNRPGTRSGDT
jgi:site-specific recombinase XerD